MQDISPKRQLLLLFSFYCFANVLASLMSIALLNFASGQVSKLSLSVISIFGFFIPAFIAFRLFSNTRLINYWGLNTSFTIKSLFTTILIMVCCIILINWLAEINKLIPLFGWMKEDEIEASIKLKQYIKMDNFWQLSQNLFIYSLVPSFCEEVFFRGTMQPIWCRYYANPWIGILITAFIFSFLHFQFLGFLPRLLAGIVFGLLFYLTGSLWLSIISHVLYNGTIVILNYLNQHNWIRLISFGNLLLSPILLLASALIIVLLFYLLQNDTFKKHHYNGN